MCSVWPLQFMSPNLRTLQQLPPRSAIDAPPPAVFGDCMHSCGQQDGGRLPWQAFGDRKAVYPACRKEIRDPAHASARHSGPAKCIGHACALVTLYVRRGLPVAARPVPGCVQSQGVWVARHAAPKGWRDLLPARCKFGGRPGHCRRARDSTPHDDERWGQPPLATCCLCSAPLVVELVAPPVRVAARQAHAGSQSRQQNVNTMTRWRRALPRCGPKASLWLGLRKLWQPALRCSARNAIHAGRLRRIFVHAKRREDHGCAVAASSVPLVL